MKQIKYALGGGEISKGEVLVKDWTMFSPRELPVPIKEGFTFANWSDERGKYIPALRPALVRDGMTLTATYDPDPMAKVKAIEVEVPDEPKPPRRVKEASKDEPKAEVLEDEPKLDIVEDEPKVKFRGKGLKKESEDETI